MILLTFSPQIDLGQLATIMVALSGGIWFASRALATVHGIKSDVARVEETLRGQAEELKKITEIFTRQAEDRVRLANLEAEVSRLRERWS